MPGAGGHWALRLSVPSWGLTTTLASPLLGAPNRSDSGPTASQRWEAGRMAQAGSGEGRGASPPSSSRSRRTIHADCKVHGAQEIGRFATPPPQACAIRWRHTELH